MKKNINHNIIEPEDLNKKLKSKSIKIIDCRWFLEKNKNGFDEWLLVGWASRWVNGCSVWYRSHAHAKNNHYLWPRVRRSDCRQRGLGDAVGVLECLEHADHLRCEV